MAFDKSGMKHMAYEAGVSRWHYTNTGDTKTTINGSGYFNPFEGYLDVGDVIFIHASDGAIVQMVTNVDRANGTVSTAAA